MANNPVIGRFSGRPSHSSVNRPDSHIICSGPEEEIDMRRLLRVSIPIETGNAAAKAGTLGSTVTTFPSLQNERRRNLPNKVGAAIF
jgi:hypothetical protein